MVFAAGEEPARAPTQIELECLKYEDVFSPAPRDLYSTSFATTNALENNRDLIRARIFSCRRSKRL
jgi:hypothetical protein